MGITIFISSCGPLQPYTIDDYRGITFQRFEESPHQVWQVIEKGITEYDKVDWKVDSIATGTPKLIITSFAPVDEPSVEQLRLKAKIRKDKGTLVSFTLQQQKDTSSVMGTQLQEKYVKPFIDELGDKRLSATNVAQQLKGTDQEWQVEDTFFNRIGFYANVDGGVSSRHNFYNTSDTLRSGNGENINYETKSLQFADAHARVGLAGIQFAEYNYEMMPNTDFQRAAYDFNEDRNVGLEKYTYGVDLLPLWLSLLPEDTSDFAGFITRLLSVRFRYVNELTQTTAEVTEPSIAYPSLENVYEGDTYSFRTKYRYRSASIPLFLFMANQGHINVGMAYWTFSRTYAMTRLPEPSPQFTPGPQYIFDADVETVGPIVEIYYEVHKSSLGRAIGRSGRTIPAALEGLRLDMFLGAGIMGGEGFTIEDGELAEVADQDDIQPKNFNAEVSLSYPIKLLKAVNFVDVSLRLGGELNAFITYFDNYYGYTKTDFIFNPWARLSLEFN
jgi:hypothetical protein